MAEQEEQANVEDLKKQMAEDLEAETGDEEKTAENRYQRLANKNRELTETVANLTAAMNGVKSDYQKQLDEAEIAKGNFKPVIDAKDAELQEMRAKIDEANLKVERLIIGRKYNIPDRWAVRIPGSDTSAIEANAMAMAEDLPKNAKKTDATGEAPSVPKNQKQSAGKYQPVSADVL